MKLWIHHPGADNPVPLWRWALFQYAECLYRLRCRIDGHHRKVEHRAVYGTRYDEDMPF